MLYLLRPPVVPILSLAIGAAPNSSLGQNVRLIRARDREGDGGGQSLVTRLSLLEAVCEPAKTRLVLGLPMGILAPRSSWLSARCAKCSWRKQARLVFPVTLLFKGREELNTQGTGEKERLGSLSFQSPEKTTCRVFKTLWVRVPVVAQRIKNPARVLEDAGSMPGLAQGVKDRRCCVLWCRSKMWLGSGTAVAVV